MHGQETLGLLELKQSNSGRNQISIVSLMHVTTKQC